MHNGGGVIEARDESMVTSSSNPLSPLPGPSVRLESQSPASVHWLNNETPRCALENIDWAEVQDQPVRMQEEKKPVL